MSENLVVVNCPNSLQQIFSHSEDWNVLYCQEDSQQQPIDLPNSLCWQPKSYFSLRALSRRLQRLPQLHNVLFCCPSPPALQLSGSSYQRLNNYLEAALTSQLHVLKEFVNLLSSQQKATKLGLLFTAQTGATMERAVYHFFKNIADGLIERPPLNCYSYGIVMTAGSEEQVAHFIAHCPQQRQKSHKNWFVFNERKKILFETASKRRA